MTAPELAILDESAPRSLAEQAYHLLVKKITRLELAPGSVLAEKALMAELGIGRTPIREALQRLAIEGLVSHFPNRGMLVSDISATSVQYIYEFRDLIDCYMSRLAATRASEDDIQDLAAVQKQFAHSIEEDDVDRFVALDRRFYEILAHAAQNAYVAEASPRIFNLHLRLWFYISKRVGGWQTVAHPHEVMTKGVVDALARRQPEEAELAMKVYISRRHEDIRALL